MARPDVVAQASACRASNGHLDELRGVVATESVADQPDLTGVWTRSPSQPETREAAPTWTSATPCLAARSGATTASLTTSTADEDGPQRPWSPDLFPLLIEPHAVCAGASRPACSSACACWTPSWPMSTGRKICLPAACFRRRSAQGHPGYLRAMHGVQPVGGVPPAHCRL